MADYQAPFDSNSMYYVLNFSSFLKDNYRSCIDSKKDRPLRGQLWSPPVGSTLKFNVDGSSFGNPGAAGVGGVLRDSSGKVVGMFSEFVGNLDAITAEILAIHRAVSLVAATNALYDKEVDFTSDSKSAVEWINSNDMGNVYHLQLIADTRDLIHSLPNSRLTFHPRISNSFADSLARRGASKMGFNLIWDFQ
ncbi:hypothetical protein Q3G72_001013 [Acer saccharum]|nr:hypothetical protein Q3G72_001013 [Acer saccharum]